MANQFVKHSVESDDPQENAVPMGPDEIAANLEKYGMGPGQPGDPLRPGRKPLPENAQYDTFRVDQAVADNGPMIQDDAKYARVVAALKRGDFHNDPDLEGDIAEQATLYKHQKEEGQRAEFAKGLDFSPAPVPDRVKNNQIYEKQRQYAPGTKVPESNWDKLEAAAGNGVDITTGAPPGVRATANLLKDEPEAALKATEYLLAREYDKQGIKLPPGVPAVFKDETTGQLAYWGRTPEGKLKPTLINSPNFGLDDGLIALDGVAQGAAEITGMALGGTAGAIAPVPGGTLAGGAAGAAAGNYATNKARLEVAKLMGLPDDIIDQITNTDLLVDAGLAAGWSVAAPVIGGSIRGIRNLGRPLENGAVGDVTKIKADWEKAVQQSKDLEAATGAKITPQLGEATGSPELMVMQENVKNELHGKEAQRLAENEIRNRMATKEALESIHQQESRDAPRLVMDPAEQGDAVKNILTKPIARAKDIQARAEADQEVLLNKVATRNPNRDMYPEVQTDLRAASEAASKYEDDAWENFRTQIELDPKKHTTGILLDNSNPNTPINRTLRNLDKQSQIALSNSLQKAQQGLVEDLGYKMGDDFRGIQLNSPYLDLHQVHKLVSHLKYVARREDASAALGWKGQDINNVINAIEDQIGRGRFGRLRAGGEVDLKTGEVSPVFDQVTRQKAYDIRGSYEAAKQSTVNYNNMFKEKAVREALEQSADGSWMKLPGNVRNLVFGKSAGPLRDVMDVVGKNPAKVAGLTDELNRMYKAAAYGADGKINQEASDRFLDQYADHISLLTKGGSETDYIRNAKDFDRVARAKAVEADRVQNLVGLAYGKKITAEGMYPGTLATDMLKDGMSLKQVMRIRDTISRVNPDLWADVRASGLDALKLRMTASNGVEANSAALRKILATNEPKLVAIYGPKYVQNLKLLQENLAHMDVEKLARSSKAAPNPTLITVMKSVLGQLHPYQRKLTAAARFQNWTHEKSLTELMTNPDKLDDLIRLGKMEPGTLRYARAWGQVVGNIDDLDPKSKQALAEYEQRPDSQTSDSPVMRRLREINAERR